MGDLGLAKPLDASRSHLRSGGRTTLIVSPSEVIMDGVYSPESDIYMWAMSMCMVAVEALGNSVVVDTRSQTSIKDAALALVQPLAPDVCKLLCECLDPDRYKRPCSSEARDRVLAAAGVWPALGECCGV